MKPIKQHEKKWVIEKFFLITKKIKRGSRKKTVTGHLPVIILYRNDWQDPEKIVIGIYSQKIKMKKKIMKYKNYRSLHFAAARVKLGLSQQQLANKLGVSKSSIGMFETGQRKLLLVLS